MNFPSSAAHLALSTLNNHQTQKSNYNLKMAAYGTKNVHSALYHSSRGIS